MTMTLANKAKIKAAKDGLRGPLKSVLTAEAVLLDEQIAAAPAIAALIKAAEDPGPHKIRTGADSVALYTFRKIGEYMGDANGAPAKSDESGKMPEGCKAYPIYGYKITDLSDEDND
jgi:hypothetical protein